MLEDNTDKIIEQYNQAMESIMKEIAIVGLAQIQYLTPVDTGNLRRSYAYKTAHEGRTYHVVFGTNIPYAIYVEMKPEARGGRPHLRRAIQSEVQEFEQIIIKHLSRIGK